jgi:anti-anti-sigma factor
VTGVVTPAAARILACGESFMTTSIPYLDVRNVGEALVLRFTRADMTDAAFINQVGDEIDQIVSGIEKPKVVVDFSEVTRLSSATLGMLVALRKTVTRQDGQMRVTHIADDLIEIFKMTRLNVTLKVCGSNEAAIDSFE